MTIGAFLAAAAGPLAKRVLGALGIGLVTVAGLDMAVNGLIDMARVEYNGLPADMLGYLATAGVPEALSIMAGAVASRVALAVIKRVQVM